MVSEGSPPDILKKALQSYLVVSYLMLRRVLLMTIGLVIIIIIYTYSLLLVLSLRGNDDYYVEIKIGVRFLITEHVFSVYVQSIFWFMFRIFATLCYKKTNIQNCLSLSRLSFTSTFDSGVKNVNLLLRRVNHGGRRYVSINRLITMWYKAEPT
mgnify:CR=1 FL=1